ncbi:MAG: nicotinate-nucleotide adenylyltransferase [Pseudomonadota bacterium]
MFHAFPRAAPGLRVGLLGGSFDPPHAGHAHITRMALRRLGLDRVWWLVTPGNPLKREGPADLASRMEASAAHIRHPRVEITDIETRIGTRFTVETLQALLRLYPGTRFVWLMGADNLASLHRWERWDWIMEHVPVGVLARPGAQVRAGLSPAARRYRRFRLADRDAAFLPFAEAPAWALLTGPMIDISSTELRRRGSWPGI